MHSWNIRNFIEQYLKSNSCFADLRLRFLTLLAAVVAGVCSLVTSRQFGAGVLEDSFASRLSTYYRTSAQFMALYGLLNFYLYTMAYVYAPALQQVYGQREYPEGEPSSISYST